MKVLANITAYQCEHCGKKSFRKLYRHEMYCKKNPLNQHKCFEYCKHLCRDKIEGQTIFTCAVKHQAMFSYLAEKRRFLEKGYLDEEVRMPLECSDYHDERIDWDKAIAKRDAEYEGLNWNDIEEDEEEEERYQSCPCNYCGMDDDNHMINCPNDNDPYHQLLRDGYD